MNDTAGKAKRAEFPEDYLYSNPNHFYSPLPDISSTLRDYDQIQERARLSLAGVDLNHSGQIETLKSFSSLYSQIEMPVNQSPTHRYYYRNDSFGYGDGSMLYCFLRHFRPARVFEIGCGFSSALILDVCERHLNSNVEITFVDPYPENLHKFMLVGDYKHRILIQGAETLPIEEFLRLESGDILFIDSSHVVKCGSDVNYLIGGVLPRLKKGVLIHFHDIFWPFEYRKDWLAEGRAWNEAYFLRSFLQFNSAFEILCFYDYLHQHVPDLLPPPKEIHNYGVSLWLRKKA